ncbi:MAG: hypothetical protein V2B18_21310 [Pseudomonadota bacterium]
MAKSAPTTAMLLDIPFFRDADHDAGYYVAACGATSRTWKGCVLYRSLDGGSSYSQLIRITNASVLGSTSGALASGTPDAWDEVNAVDVVVHGVLENYEQINAPLILIGNEIVKCCAATLVGTLGAMNIYTLSELKRGLWNTSSQVGTHVAGDRVVLLDETVTRIPGNSEDIGQAQLIKAVSFGRALASAPATPFSNTGRGLYIAVDEYGEIDCAGSADVVLADAVAQCGLLKLVGALTDSIAVVVPTRARQWMIWNATTGAYSVTVKTAAGTGKEVTQGNVSKLACDGANVIGIDAFVS